MAGAYAPVDLNENQLRTIFQTLESSEVDELSRHDPPRSQEQLFETLLRHIDTARQNGDSVRAERFYKAGISLTQHDGMQKAPYFIVFMAGLCDLLSTQQRADELDETLATHSTQLKDICHLLNEELSDPGSRTH